ncbi:MAG: PKD domain-containing protein, partial [Bacteroidetes bacterium]|nr:PKD domain-containing protein [Bacteroidota bacterium]
MRTLIFFIFLFSICQSGFSQEANNWCLGRYAGIDFNYNPPKPFISAIFSYSNGQTTESYYPQTISDCNGKLLYYVSGDSMVWNREHKVLKGSIKNYANVRNNFFIPSPGSDSFVYLFQLRWRLNYSRINNYLDSGRGDFDTTKVQVSNLAIGNFAGFIKHANDTDYWILTKADNNNNIMYAFLLTSKGINPTPVLSSFKGDPSYTGGSNYPYIRSSNNGNFIISNTPTTNQPANYYIYGFDRSSGKTTSERILLPVNNSTRGSHFSFSPNDSIIYSVIQIGINDTVIISQISTYHANPSSTVKAVFVIPTKNKYFGIMKTQLAVDNRLYIHLSSDNLYDRYLSYIKYPDVWGTGCDLVLDGFKVDSGSRVLSQQFPCHSFPVKRINPKFAVTGADGCGYDTTRFTFDGDSAFSSYRWYFGDGDSADGKSVVHLYTPGNYYVRLACTLGPCGYKQWVGDS